MSVSHLMEVSGPILSEGCSWPYYKTLCKHCPACTILEAPGCLVYFFLLPFSSLECWLFNPYLNILRPRAGIQTFSFCSPIWSERVRVRPGPKPGWQSQNVVVFLNAWFCLPLLRHRILLCVPHRLPSLLPCLSLSTPRMWATQPAHF